MLIFTFFSFLYSAYDGNHGAAGNLTPATSQLFDSGSFNQRITDTILRRRQQQNLEIDSVSSFVSALVDPEVTLIETFFTFVQPTTERKMVLDHFIQKICSSIKPLELRFQFRRFEIEILNSLPGPAQGTRILAGSNFPVINREEIERIRDKLSELCVMFNQKNEIERGTLDPNTLSAETLADLAARINTDPHCWTKCYKLNNQLSTYLFTLDSMAVSLSIEFLEAFSIVNNLIYDRRNPRRSLVVRSFKEALDEDLKKVPGPVPDIQASADTSQKFTCLKKCEEENEALRARISELEKTVLDLQSRSSTYGTTSQVTDVTRQRVSGSNELDLLKTQILASPTLTPCISTFNARFPEEAIHTDSTRIENRLFAFITYLNDQIKNEEERKELYFFKYQRLKERLRRVVYGATQPRTSDLQSGESGQEHDDGQGPSTGTQ